MEGTVQVVHRTQYYECFVVKRKECDSTSEMRERGSGNEDSCIEIMMHGKLIAHDDTRECIYSINLDRYLSDVWCEDRM